MLRAGTHDGVLASDIDFGGTQGDGHRSAVTDAVPMVAGEPVEVSFTLSALTGDCAAPRLSVLGPLDSSDGVLQAIVSAMVSP